MTRYGSPKRAGFVPMRGRKSDPNVLLTNDEDDDLSPYSFKRAGFLPVSCKLFPVESPKDGILTGVRSQILEVIFS